MSAPVTYLNGRFVPAAQARVSVADRGFLYGDGLFETVRMAAGRPLRWEAHLARFLAGVEALRLRLPLPPPRLFEVAVELARRNRRRDAVLRIQLTRGPGARGYAIGAATRPTLVLTLHPAPRIDPQRPPAWSLVTASNRLPLHDPLSPYKTCNRLPYILARADAEAAGADDALLLNTAGHVVESSRANLFWIDRGALFTPPLASGALPGVTRSHVINLARALGVAVHERTARPAVLLGADGVFLTLSTLGIVEAAALDGCRLGRTPLLRRLRSSAWEQAIPGPLGGRGDRRR